MIGVVRAVTVVFGQVENIEYMLLLEVRRHWGFAVVQVFVFFFDTLHCRLCGLFLVGSS